MKLPPAFLRLRFIALLAVAHLIIPLALRAGELIADFSKPVGKIRALNGGNGGPLNYGESVDLTKEQQELRIPYTRLHDCEAPYAEMVDIHAIFPDFKADPSLPESYRFGLTDDYLRAVNATGARIVYRLGESIEHAKRKMYIHPPQDMEKWADICVGIIRHYNEGWADGFHFEIPYWEIWNEPENPPMWTGTPEQFYRLYSITAKKIKARWPQLKVGGPALGHQGEYKDGTLKPSEFFSGLIAHIQKEKAPLDFLSWHTYTADPAEFARRTRAIRKYLDGEGFAKSESHLNEWNYLPDENWEPMLKHQGEVREQWYARQGGAEGAAFAAYALMDLQDSPLDMGNFYSMDHGTFGLFSFHATPKKTYYAFKAFRALLDTPNRVTTQGGIESELSLCAGMSDDGKSATVLVSNYKAKSDSCTLTIKGLPWEGNVGCEMLLLDETKKLEVMANENHPVKSLSLSFKLKAPSVMLIKLTRQ